MADIQFVAGRYAFGTDHMPGIGGQRLSPHDFRAGRYCRVRVCSFTFFFRNPDQLIACLDYYSKKVHPSSRLNSRGGSHWEFLRWYDKLPMYLLEEPKRLKVVRALTSALRQWRLESNWVPMSSLQRRGRRELP